MLLFFHNIAFSFFDLKRFDFGYLQQAGVLQQQGKVIAVMSVLVSEMLMAGL